ncbi:MAG: 3-dehydroquinate synthase [Bacteroidota bacterium]
MFIKSGSSEIYLAPVNQIIERKFGHLSNKQLFVLVDSNTKKHCLPLLQNCAILHQARLIEMQAGEEAKSIATVSEVWRALTQANADRGSVLINLGGGVVGDLGGFAASCYKRGIHFIQIPTTLLSMVDASIGGKTGVNFEGLKNQVGVFCQPMAVIVDPAFLRTLDKRQLLSGWAEMIKHALLQGPDDFFYLKEKTPQQLSFKELSSLIARSIKIKQQVVEEDPTENGRRKILNLGHTVGHALESISLQSSTPVLHGEAVAYGLAIELLIAHKVLKLNSSYVQEVVGYILSLYRLPFESFPKEALLKLMQHDKKNAHGNLLFVLLDEYALPKYDVKVLPPVVEQAVEEFSQMFRRFS